MTLRLRTDTHTHTQPAPPPCQIATPQRKTEKQSCVEDKDEEKQTDAVTPSQGEADSCVKVNREPTAEATCRQGMRCGCDGTSRKAQHHYVSKSACTASYFLLF